MSDQRRVLITGGSSGLGLALAVPLLRRGDHVTLLARDPVKLEVAAASLREQVPGARVGTLASDVSGPGIATDVDRAVASMGGLDLLINSAGILREGYIESLTEQDYRLLQFQVRLAWFFRRAACRDEAARHQGAGRLSARV